MNDGAVRGIDALAQGERAGRRVLNAGPGDQSQLATGRRGKAKGKGQRGRDYKYRRIIRIGE